MTIANVSEVRILALIFQAQAWARFADDAAVGAETAIGVALHVADPGEAGNMATNETSYAGYSRVNVPRTTGSWTLSGSAISPDAPGIVSPSGFIQFSPASSVQTITHWSTGESIGGACNILFSGTVSPPITTTPPGLTPRLTQATTISLD